MKNKLTDYFNGVLPPEQEASVQQWLSIHGHCKDVEDVLDSLFDGILPDREVNLDSAFASVSGKLHIRRPGHSSLWRYAAISMAAAVLALVVCIPLAYKSGSDARYQEICSIEWKELIATNSQTQTVELPDGTMLDLRPGTRLIYPSSFNGPERKVFLQGEVYAKVSKNPDCPFVISSGETEVKVYGTTFNFKSYDNLDNVELMLFDGSVCFGVNSEKLSKTVRMKPGQVAQYDRCTGRFELSEFNRSVYRSLCEDNSLFYYNLSMKDIAHDLELRFGTRIIITSEELAEARIFAMFTNNESLEEILSAIGAGRRMNVKRINNTIYLNSNTNVKN